MASIVPLAMAGMPLSSLQRSLRLCHDRNFAVSLDHETNRGALLSRRNVEDKSDTAGNSFGTHRTRNDLLQPHRLDQIGIQDKPCGAAAGDALRTSGGNVRRKMRRNLRCGPITCDRLEIYREPKHKVLLET